jgi:hypothetical protein
LPIGFPDPLRLFGRSSYLFIAVALRGVSVPGYKICACCAARLVWRAFLLATLFRPQIFPPSKPAFLVRRLILFFGRISVAISNERIFLDPIPSLWWVSIVIIGLSHIKIFPDRSLASCIIRAGIRVTGAALLFTNCVAFNIPFWQISAKSIEPARLILILVPIGLPRGPWSTFSC